jgi:hypothetical protein
MCSDPPLGLTCEVEDVLARAELGAGQVHLHISWRRPTDGRPVWLVDREGDRYDLATKVVTDDCGPR